MSPGRERAFQEEGLSKLIKGAGGGRGGRKRCKGEGESRGGAGDEGLVRSKLYVMAGKFLSVRE